MAAAELDKMDVVARLSHQALQEYEGLQRKHETATLECRRLEEERDEAFKKLHEFQQVSQMVIEEVSAIQENLEVERACRESAEALATKLNRQNRSLKRKSVMLLSHLSPDAIAEISLEDEEDEDLHPSSEVCLSPGCQTTISELRINLELTLKKKNQAVADLEAVREQLRDTREELLREKHDNTVLIGETLAQKKLLRKYDRVSQFAAEEFEALQDGLDLERTLRTEAETFARAMVVEQKQLKRQSHILLQSSSPSQALQEALSQVTSLTGELEAQRLEHRAQMKQMEERLRSGEPRRELAALRRHLEVVEEERTEYSHKCAKAEEEVKDLRFAVEELRKRLQAATNPPPAPAPPPPPPPPPPPAPLTSNPLSSLLSLIRKRKDPGADIPLVVQDSARTPEAGVRQQAVEEMMQRIKRGVQLRPVSRPADRTGRQQAERPPSDSAFQELKGIMENFNRTRPLPKPASPVENGDDELQRILLRRRDALEPNLPRTSS